MLVFAYSGFVRTLVWLAYRYLIIFTLVKTSLYDRIYLSLDWKSASLTRKVEEKVRDMKLLVKRTSKNGLSMRSERNGRNRGQQKFKKKRSCNRRKKLRRNGWTIMQMGEKDRRAMLLVTQQHLSRRQLSLRHLQKTQGSNSLTRSRLILAEQAPTRPSKCAT